MINLSLIVGLFWFVLAAAFAAMPSNDNHWRRAYILIALGIPLLGWITYENGPLMGLIFLGAGGSFLRWPVIYLVRWVRRKLAR